MPTPGSLAVDNPSRKAVVLIGILCGALSPLTACRGGNRIPCAKGDTLGNAGALAGMPRGPVAPRPPQKLKLGGRCACKGIIKPKKIIRELETGVICAINSNANSHNTQGIV